MILPPRNYKEEKQMKKLFALLLAVMMVLSLAACAGETVETKPPVEDPSEGGNQEVATPKEIVFWSLWNDGEPQSEVIKEAAAAYEAKTGVKVIIEWKGRDVNQILSASLENKEKIDIIEDDYQRIAMVYPNIADLTELAKAAGYKGYDCLNNQVIEWAGHLNSIVEQPQVGGVFYNKDLFAEAGVSEPKTWAEFMDVCQKLVDSGVAPMALDSAYADFMFYHALVSYMDEAAIEKVAKEGGWSNTDAVKAAQDTIDFVKAGFLADGAPDEYPSNQNKLGTDEAAMIVCANYVTAEVNNNMNVELNWGLFGYPGCSAAYGGANSLAVTDYSENKQEAFDFIMFLVTGEYDQKMADTIGQIPADPTNKAPAHLSGTIETLLAAEKPMTWCAGLNANADLINSCKTIIVELYEGKYETGEDFCAALDALY